MYSLWFIIHPACTIFIMKKKHLPFFIFFTRSCYCLSRKINFSLIFYKLFTSTCTIMFTTVVSRLLWVLTKHSCFLSQEICCKLFLSTLYCEWRMQELLWHCSHFNNQFLLRKWNVIQQTNTKTNKQIKKQKTNIETEIFRHILLNRYSWEYKHYMLVNK